MKCSLCSSNAVVSNPALCSDHLVSYVRETTLQTVSRYSLFSMSDRVVVAASGGKDSVALLDVLSSLGFNVSALAIDEGISSYRASTLEDLRSFCSSRSIPLRIVSFEEEYGASLDVFVSKNDVVPCRVCGVFRRQLLNKHSRGFDAVATGHNLDDELQNIFLNLLKNNIDLLARLGPKTGLIADPSFVPRVKPFYFIPEKLIRAYVIVRGIDVRFVECPYARHSFRHRVASVINSWESSMPGAKVRIIKNFLKILPSIKDSRASFDISLCPSCGSPSAGGLCRACSFVSSLKK